MRELELAWSVIAKAPFLGGPRRNPGLTSCRGNFRAYLHYLHSCTERAR